MPVAQNLIFNNMNEAIVVLDIHGRIIKYNKATTELFNLSNVPIKLYSKKALIALILT